jgi:hypothetical protein
LLAEFHVKPWDIDGRAERQLTAREFHILCDEIDRMNAEAKRQEATGRG